MDIDLMNGTVVTSDTPLWKSYVTKDAQPTEFRGVVCYKFPLAPLRLGNSFSLLHRRDRPGPLLLWSAPCDGGRPPVSGRSSPAS